MLTNNKTYNKTNLRDIQKSFNDGICYVYQANERQLGDFIGQFHYANESVGINQYWNAQVNNVNIDLAISIPTSIKEITNQDVIKIDDIFYNIRRLQYHDKGRPNYWTISLSRSVFSYD